MAKFHGIFAIFSDVKKFTVKAHGLVEDGQSGRVEDGQNFQLGHAPLHGVAMTPIGIHTMAHAILIGHRDVQSAVGAILGPHHLSTLH